MQMSLWISKLLMWESRLEKTAQMQTSNFSYGKLIVKSQKAQITKSSNRKNQHKVTWNRDQSQPIYIPHPRVEAEDGAKCLAGFQDYCTLITQCFVSNWPHPTLTQTFVWEHLSHLLFPCLTIKCSVDVEKKTCLFNSNISWKQWNFTQEALLPS